MRTPRTSAYAKGAEIIALGVGVLSTEHGGRIFYSGSFFPTL